MGHLLSQNRTHEIRDTRLLLLANTAQIPPGIVPSSHTQRRLVAVGIHLGTRWDQAVFPE